VAVKKSKSGGSFSTLIREAGEKTKALSEAELSTGDVSAVGPDGRPIKIFNVIQYAESAWGLKMKLYPVQRFIIKLHYNLPLDDTEKTIEVTDRFRTQVRYRLTEVEYLHFLYEEGRCNIPEQDHERRQLILPVGRRSGKSTLSAVFASYEIYRLLSLKDPHTYYGLPRGNQIKLISVATGKEQAAILYNDITAHLTNCEFFKPYAVSKTSDAVQFMTPSDLDRFGYGNVHRDNGKFQSFKGKASIKVAFAAAASNRIRGSGCIVIIMDEMAHFLETGTSSAKDIYDAVIPSALAFSPKDPATNRPKVDPKTGQEVPVDSRIICISSPLNRSGKFYELYHYAMSRAEGTENMLVVQAPTWEVNPTVSSSFLKEQYHQDPLVFETEFGAAFSDRRRGWIERSQDLLDCVRPEHRPRTFGPPRVPHQMGIDLALVGDNTAVAITHLEGDKVILDYHEQWGAGVSWRDLNPHLTAPLTDYAKTTDTVARLDFDAISEWIEALTKKFYITAGLFDRWNGIPLEQSLHKKGLRQFTSEFFNRDVNSKMFQAMKLFIYDRRLVLYDWPLPSAGGGSGKHSQIISELLTLQATQITKNQVIVEAPQTQGFHDDLSDALVRAFWLSLERLGNQKIVATSSRGPGGTPAPRYNTSTGYQVVRMRSHGTFTDRMSPRNPRRR
jgi:hypothetical protein